MVQIPTSIENILRQFLSDFERAGYQVEQAILFGSYARGTQNEWSDIDLAKVSENFTGNRLMDKARIRKINGKVNYAIAPMPFRPEDFDASNLFVKEILETGIRVI